MMKLGVIGLGTRIHDGVLPALCDYSDEFCITAVADPQKDLVLERAKEKPRGYAEKLNLYTEADELLEKEDLDGIIIGTRCSLHTPLAIKAMERNVPIFLEKPVATNIEDLQKLVEANKKYNPRVVVSFPLRFSAISVFVKELIDSGKIGDVLQVNAFNDVPYGRIYFHNWYRNEGETGGLWLQKATHDFDYLNYVLGDKAEEIFARYNRTLFKGDMPAGLKCADCEKKNTCPEGPYMVEKIYQDKMQGEYCCFAEDTGNEDCGTALVKYKSGTILSYSQNFFARHKARRRGARFYGYKGTLEFDWYKNEVKVYMHNAPRVETHTFDSKGRTHFGGDIQLADFYYKMIKGQSNKSYLMEGVESAHLCLMAKKSCETGQNIIIPEL